MAIPTEYISDAIVDDDGRDRTIIHAYSGSEHVADIVFKARDELPSYSHLRGSGAVFHFGEPPRYLGVGEDAIDGAACVAAHEEWRRGFGAGSGVPQYVVDSSPIGIAELASRLSGQPRWQTLAHEMRDGRWSGEALKLADALVAVTCVEPGREQAVETARDQLAAYEARQWELTGLALTAVFRGEITPEIAALEERAPQWYNAVHWSLQHLDRTGLSPERRSYWAERIAALAAEGKLHGLFPEMLASVGGDHEVSAEVTEALRPILEVTRKRFEGADRDDGSWLGQEWVERTRPDQWFTESAEPERILMVARALAGDETAIAHVQASLAMLRRHDAFLEFVREKSCRSEAVGQFLSTVVPAAHTTQELEAQLIVVHATNHPPTRTDDGALQLQPRFNTTGFPRSSLHFTLNHVVEDHLAGAWSDMGYVVVAPFAGVRQRNGVPANLLGVDTWWEVDPGAALTLPDAVLIQVDPQARELLVDLGDTIVVKAANFSSSDIDALVAAGQLDVAELHADVARFCAGNPDLVPADLREGMIAGAARNFALATVAKRMGVELAQAEQWGIDIGPSVVRPLARALGTEQRIHSESPANYAEESIYRGLNSDGPKAKIPQRLARTSPEARRVAVAAGAMAPLAQRVVHRTADLEVGAAAARPVI